jgi:hypothetical protein
LALFTLTRKVAQVLAVGFIATALLGSSGLSAQAAEPLDPQTQQYVDTLTSKLTTFGVAPEVRAQLIEKYLKGEQLDAEKGIDPVSETTSVKGRNTVTRYVYADGSVAISTVERPTEGDRSGRNIEGCQHSVDRDSHTYKNCHVGWDAASWSVGYFADYGYYQFGNWMGNLRGLTAGGVGSFASPQIQTVVSSCNTSCSSFGLGTYLQSLTVGGVGVTRTVGVKIEVNNGDKRGGKSSAVS